MIVSSSPSDMDYWQGCKAQAALLRREKGGIVIFAAPAEDWLTTIPRFRGGSLCRLKKSLQSSRRISGGCERRCGLCSAFCLQLQGKDKSKIFCVSDGLTERTSQPCSTSVPQRAGCTDEALRIIPDATIGIILKGDICLSR